MVSMTFTLAPVHRAVERAGPGLTRLHRHIHRARRAALRRQHVRHTFDVTLRVPGLVLLGQRRRRTASTTLFSVESAVPGSTSPPNPA